MPRERMSDKRARAGEALERLALLYPHARTELDFGTPFQLLVATILSAQATDAGVNAVTPQLFAVYPDAFALARARPEDVEPLINRIGLFRTKAKNIVGAARILAERHGGEVPDDFAALLELPGVGRKTANVVLGVIYARPGIAVDTHVLRVSKRLGFSKGKDPDSTERELQKLFPETQWVFVHHALILHGRRVCKARRPQCGSCVLNDICPSSLV